VIANVTPVKICVLGAGRVGGTLAAALAAADHDVVLGVLDPGEGWRTVGDGAQLPARPVGGALSGAEVVIAAVPGATLPNLVRDHAGALDGLVVIDVSNNTAPGAPISVLPVLREVAPQAHGYRAFNSVGWENFTDSTSDLFYAGPAARRDVVERLIADIGPRPVWIGEDARAYAAVDGLTMLWFGLVMGQGVGRRIAFKLTGTDAASLG
jgi:predicted dinucleotide-binding enzyme